MILTYNIGWYLINDTIILTIIYFLNLERIVTAKKGNRWKCFKIFS
jgi:hypothetical protein